MIFGISIVHLDARLFRIYFVAIVVRGAQKTTTPVQRIVVASQKAINVGSVGHTIVSGGVGAFGKPHERAARVLLGGAVVHKMVAKGRFAVNEPGAKARPVRKVVRDNFETVWEQDAHRAQDTQCAGKESAYQSSRSGAKRMEATSLVVSEATVR